ncbi:hypothetical protein LINPERPRIM_LOCUS20771 [Linum perenne]
MSRVLFWVQEPCLGNSGNDGSGRSSVYTSHIRPKVHLPRWRVSCPWRQEEADRMINELRSMG